jgi:phage repressor protein C with HTH and peptisase S24 domain
LDIPNEGFNPDSFNKTVEKMKAGTAEGYRRFMQEGKYVSDVATKGRIPLYAPGDGTGPRLINAIPRAYPVEFAEDAYGLVMFGTEMEPAIRNGEIAIVNPNLPPLWQSEVVVILNGKPTIRTFVGETDTVWAVQQWNPPAKTNLKKDDHETPQLVVAKIGRST